MSLFQRARELLAGARSYRYEGEQASHAEQLRETEISLSLMAGADTENPDQVRMASDIEDGAESRLTVLLGKARLTLAEKRERDAIQAAIAARRQGFGDAPPVLVERSTQTRMARFLAPLAASPALAILLSPWTWLVASLALVGLQTARLNNAKGDLQDVRADLAMSERNARDLATTNERLTAEVNNANRDASVSAANWQAERDRRVRAQQDARRIRDAVEQARAGNSVDYGFGSVRDAGAASPGATGGDTAGRDPG